MGSTSFWKTIQVSLRLICLSNVNRLEFGYCSYQLDNSLRLECSFQLDIIRKRLDKLLILNKLSKGK